MTVLLLSRQCDKCTHLNGVKGDRWTCSAFPNGIPYEIATEQHNHQTPFPGDNGIQFALKTAQRVKEQGYTLRVRGRLV